MGVVEALVGDFLLIFVALGTTTSRTVATSLAAVEEEEVGLHIQEEEAVWSMANQMQLLLLLILTGAYLPPNVKDYIGGNTFASFNFNFIHYTHFFKKRNILFRNSSF